MNRNGGEKTREMYPELDYEVAREVKNYSCISDKIKCERQQIIRQKNDRGNMK